MIKVIIFDWGNVITLYDTPRFIEFMSSHLSVSKELFAKVELESRILYDNGDISTDGFVERINEGLGSNVSTKEFFKLMDDSSSGVLNDYVVNLIKDLKNNYRLFVLSNNSPPIIEYIKKHELNYLFDKMLFSFQVHMKKSNPEFFRLLLKDTPFLPEECLFIDDLQKNCAIASSLGMKTIQYENNDQLKSSLAAFSIKF